MVIVDIGVKHGIEIAVGLLDFRLIFFELHINLVNLVSHGMVLIQYFIQLLSHVTKKFAKKRRIFLELVNVKLLHDLCKRIEHLARIVQLCHIDIVQHDVRSL